MKAKICIPLYVLASMLYSCQAIELSTKPMTYSIYAIDFSEFADQGFLITSSGYGGDFVSLGYYEILFDPERRQVSKERADELRKAGETIRLYGRNYFHVIKPNPRECLKIFVAEAQARGGNGVTEYRIHSRDWDFQSSEAPQDGVKMTGYIIRRP